MYGRRYSNALPTACSGSFQQPSEICRWNHERVLPKYSANTRTWLNAQHVECESIFDSASRPKLNFLEIDELLAHTIDTPLWSNDLDNYREVPSLPVDGMHLAAFATIVRI